MLKLLPTLAFALLTLPAIAQESITTLDPPGAGGVAIVGGPCGTQPISIARMQWPSAEILAEIHARLLAQHFGCTVGVVPGDLAATGSSMSATGQPAIAPELWITRIAEIWNAGIEAQTLRPAGQSFVEATFEGWFVPGYVADKTPELTIAANLVALAPALVVPGQNTVRFISCPPDWGCAVINRNLVAALGLTGIFEIIEPANRFEMDTLIAEAVSRQEPVVFYYWQPNAVLNQLDFRSVDLGAYQPEAFQCLARRACAALSVSAFPPETVVIAAAEWVFTDTPEIASYLQRAAMPIAEMNKLLARLGETGATPETVADRFIAERKSVWGHWVGLPADQIPIDPPPEPPVEAVPPVEPAVPAAQ